MKRKLTSDEYRALVDRAANILDATHKEFRYGSRAALARDRLAAWLDGENHSIRTIMSDCTALEFEVSP